MKKTAPTALAPPGEDVVLLSDQLIDGVINQSRIHPRRRMIQPLHKSADAPVHRMLNAIQPDSYIQPHRHWNPPKSESVIVLRGSLATVLFDGEGRITAIHRLQAGSSIIGIDIEAGLFHTFLALHPDTVIFEIKPGPYTMASDKDFAPWAPPPETANAAEYLATLHRLLQPE